MQRLPPPIWKGYEMCGCKLHGRTADCNSPLLPTLLERLWVWSRRLLTLAWPV
jgi:hypothetical protein